MKILGIDYGDKRIGLAISDPLGIIASPLMTYEKKDDQRDLEFFASLIKDKQITKIVLGLPINMDGTEGERAKIVREFANKLSALGVEIIFKDERLSSVSANRVLDEANMHWSKRKKVVDTIAAQIILQSYLDKQSR